MFLLTVIFYICLLFILLFLAFMILFYEWRWPSHRKECYKLPKGRRLNFIFGVGLELLMIENHEIFTYMEKLWKGVPTPMYIEIFGVPYVIILEPEDVELVMNNSQHITKGIEYLCIKPWLCEGLLTSTGSKWQLRRKMLTPTFHFKILENYMSTFNRHAKLLTEKLTAAAPESISVDIDEFVSLCTLDIICETAMGTSFNFQMGEAPEYLSALRTTADIVLKRSLTFWMFKDWLFNISPTGRKFNKAVKQLHKFTEKVIKERKRTYSPDNWLQYETEMGMKKRKSFLDYLIEMQRENPTQMTDEGIREEVDTFMFEGHDTTSVAISWTLFAMACHQDIQDKVREEIEDIFGDSDRDISIHDVNQLRYLDLVIKESMRLYPSVPYLSRFTTNPLKTKNYVIPPQTNVVIMPFFVHRLPNIYPEPEKFIPERFLPGIAKNRHPFSYIPFSAGYRNCIGQKFALLEDKVVLITILRKLKVNTEMKREDIKMVPALVLRPYPKLRLSFTPVKNEKLT